jgi:hypothetical protein
MARLLPIFLALTALAAATMLWLDISPVIEAGQALAILALGLSMFSGAVTLVLLGQVGRFKREADHQSRQFDRSAALHAAQIAALKADLANAITNIADSAQPAKREIAGEEPGMRLPVVDDNAVTGGGNIVFHPKHAKALNAAKGDGLARVETPRKRNIIVDTMQPAFEPILSMPDGSVCGYRVLAAFATGSGENVFRQNLIGLASPMDGASFSIDLLRSAAMAARQHFNPRRSGPKIRLFCPLTGAALRDRSTFDRLRAMIATTPALADAIVLDINAGELMLDDEQTGKALFELRQSGFSLSVSLEIGSLPSRRIMKMVAPVAVFVSAPLFEGSADNISEHERTIVDAGLSAVTRIAVDVSSETTAVAAVDHGITQLTGPFFSPPRLLRGLSETASGTAS